MYKTLIYKPNAPLKMAQISLSQFEEYEQFEYTNMDRLVKNIPPLPTPPHLIPIKQSVDVVQKSLQNYPGSNSEMKEYREMVCPHIVI